MLVKCRKQHKCDNCGLIIKIGEYADFYTGKNPVFDKTDKDKQVGIKYYKEYLCSSFDGETCEIQKQGDEDYQDDSYSWSGGFADNH